jgi:hypothetical protein
VGYSKAAYGGSDASLTGTVTGTRTGDTSGTVTVKYSVSAGTAGGSDFTAKTGMLTFGPGATARNFAVAVANDTLVEGTEIANLTLSNPVGGVLGTAASKLRINDNDGPAVFFDYPNYKVSEGDSPVTLVVRRTGSATVTVRVTTEDLAATGGAGGDYQRLLNKLVTIPAGVASVSVNVNITDDGLAEPSEAFRVRLSEPTGAPLGTQRTAVVTITDNDQ